jgi:hypothetical protein
VSEDLIAFLRARLAEDEAAAQAASDGPWMPWHGRPGLGLGHLEFGIALPGQGSGSLAAIATELWLDAEHIARHDPVRVLREVEAKRAIVDEIERELADDPTSETDRWRLSVLAAVYRDHPDYRQEWAP